MTKKAKKQFDKLIDDALMLINIPAAKDDNEKLSAKERRAQARTRLETIMEKKRLQSVLSDGYDYYDDDW